MPIWLSLLLSLLFNLPSFIKGIRTLIELFREIMELIRVLRPEEKEEAYKKMHEVYVACGVEKEGVRRLLFNRKLRAEMEGKLRVLRDELKARRQKPTT